MKTFLITGAAGLLGSHLTGALLMAGHPVIALVRRKNGFSGKERMEKRLEWLGLEADRCKGCRVVEGELSRPRLGLDSEKYKWLTRQTDEIIHCAANTSFSEKLRPEVQTGNITALFKLMLFATEADVSFFHLVSTAFVGPVNAQVCYERLYQSHTLLNVYEETKQKAELEMASFCQQKNIPWSIYRPSIVYGHSQTGKTFRFNALYYPLKTLHLLWKMFLKDLSQGARSCRELGVYLNSRDYLYMPIEIEQGSGGINLVPIDYFTRAFLELMLKRQDQAIYHITNPRPSSLAQLVGYTSRFLRIDGIGTVTSTSRVKGQRNALESLFDKYLGEYNPYLRDQRTFDTSAASAALAPKGIECPEMDYSIFEKVMQYALKTNWGKALMLE